MVVSRNRHNRQAPISSSTTLASSKSTIKPVPLPKMIERRVPRCYRVLSKVQTSAIGSQTCLLSNTKPRKASLRNKKAQKNYKQGTRCRSLKKYLTKRYLKSEKLKTRSSSRKWAPKTPKSDSRSSTPAYPPPSSRSHRPISTTSSLTGRSIQFRDWLRQRPCPKTSTQLVPPSSSSKWLRCKFPSNWPLIGWSKSYSPWLRPPWTPLNPNQSWARGQWKKMRKDRAP